MKLSELRLSSRSAPAIPRWAIAATVGAAALGALALAALKQAAVAEENHPPEGAFLEIDGVRLHYIERGEGEPLLLLHGNVTQIADFETSGLIDLAAQSYRVIVFDRPGFGHSSRPFGAIWTPSAQADLFRKALAQLGVESCVVLGHSLGATVAMALALNHPAVVKRLVLVSGYYYPTDRFDALLQAIRATPVLGDVLRYTLSPLLARFAWGGTMKKIFSPRGISKPFSDAVREMALRPSQLQAISADAALMIPNAAAMRERYGELSMPVSIVVGADDRLINVESQSKRLHRDIPGSSLKVVPGFGHMVHHGGSAALIETMAEAA